MPKISKQVLLEFRCRLEELVTHREGMIAENLTRQFLGHGMAYDDEAFDDLANKIAKVGSDLVLLGEST